MKSPVVFLVCLLMLLTGCSGSSSEGGGGGEKKGATAKKEPTASATPEPEPEPIMLGTQRYVSPCRLLTQEDVQRIYGDPGAYAHINQEFAEKSVPTAEMRSITQTIGGAVKTTCRYTFDDKQQTAIDLNVDQYISPRRALKAWKNIKKLGTGIDSKQLANESGPEWLIKLARENEASMGGVPVRELDPSILFVAGKTHFTGVRRNVLLTLSKKAYAGNFFEPKQIKGALRTTREAFRRIYAKVDDQQLEQTTAPAYWQQPEGWAEFLEPCTIFDDTVMTELTGHATDKVESTSVVRDPGTRLQRNTKPGDTAVYNDCERTARVRAGGRTKRSWNTSIQIWYAAPGVTGQPLLEGVMLRKFFRTEAKAKYTIADVVKAKLLTPVEIEGADGAYVFHNEAKGLSFGWIAANVGPYVVVFDASTTKGLAFSSKEIDQPARLAAVAAIVANIKKATSKD